MIPIDRPEFWLLAILGVTMTGISKSGFAGGAGVVAVPLLALIMPVPIAAALMLPLLLVMDAKTVSLYKHHLDNILQDKIILIGALLGIALAGFAFNQLNANTLQTGLGILSVLFAAWHRLTPLLGKIPYAAAMWGILSGISSTLLHAGGPPITIYFLSLKLSKQQWIARAAIFFAFMNLIKLVPYSLSGLFNTDMLIVSIALLPIALVGVKLGHLLQKTVTENQFTQLCRTLLFISGSVLIFKSIA